MGIPIDSKKQWFFLYHDVSNVRGVPLKVEKKEGKILLEAYEGFSKVEIQLTAYNKSKKEISGEYTLCQYPFAGKVSFGISPENTKKWIGFPTGFNGIRQWTIWRD